MITSQEKCGCCKAPAIYHNTLVKPHTEWNKDVDGSDLPWYSIGLEAENSLFKIHDYPLSNGCPKRIWQAKSVNGESDGGYDNVKFTDQVDVHAKYRRSVWIKRLDDQDGGTYMGIKGKVSNNLSGALDSNPYFFYDDLPEVGKWYLIVGYVHPASETNGTELEGGIYELGNPNKVADIAREFRWEEDATDAYIRDYFYYTSDPGKRQWFFDPRMEKIDGTEMPLSLLLGL